LEDEYIIIIVSIVWTQDDQYVVGFRRKNRYVKDYSQESP